MKYIKLFEKTYTIDGKEFFDYGTEDVNSNDLFDTHKTGMSFYDDLLNNPEYMRKNKNLTSKFAFFANIFIRIQIDFEKHKAKVLDFKKSI